METERRKWFHRNEEIATSYQQVGFIAVKNQALVSCISKLSSALLYHLDLFLLTAGKLLSLLAL